MSPEERRGIYKKIHGEIEALLGEIGDEITLQSITAAILKDHLPYASWVGFYRVSEPGLLRVGPYRGPLPCLEIPFGKGVCGAAAAERRTLLVSDVHAFPGHIACDASSRSEIVLPIENSSGDLIAVLDLDSRQPDAFNDVDHEGLERVAAFLAARLH